MNSRQLYYIGYFIVALIICFWINDATASSNSSKNKKSINTKKNSTKKILTTTTTTATTTIIPNNFDINVTDHFRTPSENFEKSSASSALVQRKDETFEELTKLMKQKRKDCKKVEAGKKNSTTTTSVRKSFFCERLKWNSWLLDQLKKNSTKLISQFVKLTKNPELSDSLVESEIINPENWGEQFVYKMIQNYGEPVDKLLFYQFKKYTKSRELEVSIPKIFELKVSPRTHQEGSTGRTLFDPGFNLKLKLPFLKDELKVAVSTGPSFLAGLGVGLVVLGIKSLLSPLILAVKYYILTFFFKDLSPFDFLKAITGHFLPSFGPPPPEPDLGWEPDDGGYEPSVYNNYDYGPIPDKKTTYGGYGGGGYPSYFGGDQSHQFSQVNPIIQQNSFQQSSPPSNFPMNAFLGGDGRNQLAKPQDNDKQNSGFNFASSQSLQLDVENFDPFYSPLLSRIDSIFMHLGFSEEGCKEQAVCSIYKFPVKYAPYSNLLSAQLSKHQSELKRPVTTSPKVLRYFKYMKAAKDGQAALNCLELYPNCTNDTEKLSNLPMVKTFQQLTELMGTGSG